MFESMSFSGTIKIHQYLTQNNNMIDHYSKNTQIIIINHEFNMKHRNSETSIKHIITTTYEDMNLT